MGIPELSLNADRGQPHLAPASEIGTRFREPKILPDRSRRWIQIRSGRNCVAGQRIAVSGDFNDTPTATNTTTDRNSSRDPGAYRRQSADPPAYGAGRG